MEREVGERIGMGNTCKPMAVSFQCMTKSTTNKKIIIIKKPHMQKQKKKEILHKTSLGGSVCGISHIEEAKRRGVSKKAEEG